MRPDAGGRRWLATLACAIPSVQIPVSSHEVDWSDIIEGLYVVRDCKLLSVLLFSFNTGSGRCSHHSAWRICPDEGGIQLRISSATKPRHPPTIWCQMQSCLGQCLPRACRRLAVVRNDLWLVSSRAQRHLYDINMECSALWKWRWLRAAGLDSDIVARFLNGVSPLNTGSGRRTDDGS